MAKTKTKTKTKDPLEGWRKTTVWLRVLDGPLVEIDVFHPASCSENERVSLLAKHASQGVKIIRQLTETSKAIIQGQYEERLDE